MCGRDAPTSFYKIKLPFNQQDKDEESLASF